MDIKQDASALERNMAVLKQNPNDREAIFNLAVIHDQAGNLATAEEYYRRFLTVYPADATVLKNLASICFDQGRSSDARSLYQQILSQYPYDIDAHFAYSKTGRYERDDQVLLALEAATELVPDLTAEQIVKLCYTLGKANQDIGEYKAAYSAFQTGGDLHFQMLPFDERSHFNMIDDAQLCFSRDYCNRAVTSGVTDATPIFILGMPRSGSTLIEQILDCHSGITGAGELDYLKQSIQTHLIGDKGTFSKAIGSWNQQKLANTAHSYLERLVSHAEPGQKIVDKMPGNFVFVGLIYQLFPNAKIIHSTRHPMATIWSNFSTLFADGLKYTYRLDVLARYYQKYRQLMTHWQSSLPSQLIYSLDYESLVQFPEAEVKALLQYLDLPWDPNCLDFYANKRRVKTASIMQVREPLYRSSIDMWQNYQSQLAEIEAFLSQ